MKEVKLMRDNYQWLISVVDQIAMPRYIKLTKSVELLLRPPVERMWHTLTPANKMLANHAKEVAAEVRDLAPRKFLLRNASG
jgi:hypothetical protein